jgi:hypothetical protein
VGENIILFMKVVRHLKMYVPALPPLVFMRVLLQQCTGGRGGDQGHPSGLKFVIFYPKFSYFV